MYLTSGAKVRTIRFRSWGSFVSRYFFHSASVSSWEMRFRLLGSSFIGSSGSFGRGGARGDRPEARGPLALLNKLRAFPRRWSLLIGIGGLYEPQSRRAVPSSLEPGPAARGADSSSTDYAGPTNRAIRP